MEEKLKTSPLKKDIDDIMLKGAFVGAYLTQRYGNIRRIDGHSHKDHVIRDLAMDLAKEKDTDGIVAGGIATAILDSIIIYGDIGEKFLKEKLAQEGESFSREEYAVDVAKSITSLYQYDRKQGIIEGVKAAFCNDSNNIDANIAKTAIMQNEYFCEDRFPEAYAFGERFIKEGTLITIEKLYRRLECMHHKSISNEQALKNLNLAYNHLQNNYDKISDEYKASYPDLSQNKVIAYLIANLHDTEMERVLKDAKEEKTNEER